MTRARSEERGNDMRDGEWTKESRFGVWTTGAGVCGTDVTNGEMGDRSFENWDWMSPKEREEPPDSKDGFKSQNAGDSGGGEETDLCDVGCVKLGYICAGERLERIFDGAEKFVTFKIKLGDCG